MTPNEMKQRLFDFFPGCEAEVDDLTGTHDHYSVGVVSSKFAGLTRIRQHQLVMKAFEEELRTGEVHALSIRTEIPPNK